MGLDFVEARVVKFTCASQVQREPCTSPPTGAGRVQCPLRRTALLTQELGQPLAVDHDTGQQRLNGKLGQAPVAGFAQTVIVFCSANLRSMFGRSRWLCGLAWPTISELVRFSLVMMLERCPPALSFWWLALVS